jgi:sugar phosphate isomerase/epimerase
MEIGISSYTFTWATGVSGSMPVNPLSPFDLVDKTVRHDLTIVQIADNLPLEILSGSQIDDLREYAAHRGISVEMGGRGLTMQHSMQCLITAERLGSPVLRMVIDSADFEPDLPTIISIVRELVPELVSRKIKLAIENHDRLKAREFEKIILSAGSEMVGICLDSVNSMGAGEGFETVSEILLPYTINLHIKDFTIRRVPHKMGLVIEGTPAGRGMLNIKELIHKLDATKRCRSAILELWTPPGDSVEETIKKEEKWAEESIKYLKAVAGE